MLSSSSVAELSAPSSLFFYALASTLCPITVFFLLATLGVQVGRIMLPPLLFLLPLHRITHWPKRFSFAVQCGAVATGLSAAVLVIARVPIYDVTPLLVWYATACSISSAVAVSSWRRLPLVPVDTPRTLTPWWLRSKLFSPALSLLALSISLGLTLGPVPAAVYAAAGLAVAVVGVFRARADSGPDPVRSLRSASNDISLSALQQEEEEPITERREQSEDELY